jgi:hypothetical protein
MGLHTAVSRACAICSTGWGNRGLANVPSLPNRRPLRWRLLTKLPAQLPLSAAAPPAKTIELGGQDQTRLGPKGRRTHGCAPTGSRPPLPRDTRYDNADSFGACGPERECAVGLMLPRANPAMRQWHRNQSSAQLPAHVHPAMITDGAGWHRAQALRLPSHITLIAIPPYTPHCKPAAKPWPYLKANCLSHRRCVTYQDILDACQHAWNSRLNQTGRIASLTSRHHPIHHET